MAINQILSIPDWQKQETFTSSNPNLPGFSQIYPGPDKYWYVKDGDGSPIRRLALDYQFGNGFSTALSPTDSLVDYRVDVNVGSGLSYSYDGIGSKLIVTGLTQSNLYLTNTFTQGYALSYNTTSNAFEWTQMPRANIAGSSGSLVKFNSATGIGDSLFREEDGVIYMGLTPSAVKPYIGLGISQSVNIGGKIYLNNDLNRFIDGTSSVELRTTSDFLVSSYPILLGSTSIARFIDAKTDLTTYSNTFGYDRHIEFLSGLVSANQRPGYPALFVNATPAGLTGVSPSNSLIRTPTFSFSSTNPFLNRIVGTFGVALGLSGGGLQIKDGTEGQYKVLVSSTTQGHGIWATMVEIGTAQRIPIYQRTDDFNLGQSITFTNSVRYPSTGPTFTRSFVTTLTIATQTVIQDFVTGLGNPVDFRIPNVGATGTIDFIMSRSNQTKYGSLRLYDENELVGSMSQNYGLLVKDLSNTDINYFDSTSLERNSRHNAILQLLTSEKSPTFSSDIYNSGSRTIQAWTIPSVLLPKPFGWTAGWTTSVPNDYNVVSGLDRLSKPTKQFFPRSVVDDTIYFRQPQNQVFSQLLNRNVWADPGRDMANNLSSTKYSDGLDTQIVRRKSTLYINQNWQPIGGHTAGSPQSFTNTIVPNLIYQFDFSRMGATISNVRMDTILGNWLRVESGEWSGRLTQSTGLFINPQFGSFTASGIGMTLSRMVGVQVAQEVGLLTYNPNGFVQEAYDYISARIANGASSSNIGSHVGFFAQSKLMGTIWDPTGRRTYDYGQSLGTLNTTDQALYSSTSGRLTPQNWPSYSIYPNKPWAFFAEKDKSNFGGGVLIDINASFSTSLNAYLEIQGVTGLYNTYSFPRTMIDFDGSFVTVSALSYSTLLPQILLRPGLTLSNAADGSLFYTPGYLGFFDNGTRYNLLSPQSIPPPGLTGLGVSGYVPVWTLGDTLRGTSSIFVTEAGAGNVGIRTIVPTYPLQIATASTASLLNSGLSQSFHLWNIALGISGSIQYQDGSHGITGSVLMADSTGKTNLYPLILPGPGLTASFTRVGPSFSSGYIPLYVGTGNTAGPSGSSEYQLGSIMRDPHDNEISLLIRPQAQFASSNPLSGGATKRSLTLVVPNLTPVQTGSLTQSVEFLMSEGDQNVRGHKIFSQDGKTRTSVNIVNMGDTNNIGLHYLLTGGQALKIMGANRPFASSAPTTVNYTKSILTSLNSYTPTLIVDGFSTGLTATFPYSRAAISDSLGAYFHTPTSTGQLKNYDSSLNQSIGRYIDTTLANNYTISFGNARIDERHFISEFHFSKISTTQSNLNRPTTFLSNYYRSEFGHDFVTSSAGYSVTSRDIAPTGFATSSVNLMTGLFINNQVGGFTWSYATATYSIGVYSRQDVDSGRVTRAYDFFASRMGASASLSRIDNHVGFYAQSKVFGATTLDPTGRLFYGFDSSSPWAPTFSYGWTSGNNAPWSFFAESDKAGFGGGILLMGTNSEVVRAVNATPSYDDILGVYNNGRLPSWLTIQEPLSDRPQISLLPYTKRAVATINVITFIPNGVTMSITTNYPSPGTIVVPTFSTSGSTTTTGNANQFASLINQGGIYNATRTGAQTLTILGPLYAGSAVNSSTFSFNLGTFSNRVTVGAFSGGIDTPQPLTTSDGDMWHTGTALYFKSAGATYNLLIESKGPTGAQGSTGPIGLQGLTGGRNGLVWQYLTPTAPGLGSTSQGYATGSFGVVTGKIYFNSSTNFNKIFISSIDMAVRYQETYLQTWKPGDIIIWNLSTGIPVNTVSIAMTIGTSVGPLGSASMPYYEFSVSKLSDSAHPNAWANGSLLSLLHQPIGPTGTTGTSINWSGIYSTSSTYNYYNAVNYEGSSYLLTTTSSIGQTPSTSADWKLMVAKGATGVTGVAGVGTFSQSQFFTNGASLSSDFFLTLGAAGTTSPGIVHTGSQTFSGDKTFFDDVFIGPTSSNGLYFYTSLGTTYSGLIGPTGATSNLIYRLPSAARQDRYLKIDSQDGNGNYNLVWGTVSAIASSTIDTLADQILVGDSDGFGFTSSVSFKMFPTPMNLQAACNSTISNATTNECQNTILGGQEHCINKSKNTIIIGGDNATASCQENAVIIGGKNNYIKAVSGSVQQGAAIIGGENNLIHNTGGSTTNQNIIAAGKCNTLYCKVQMAAIIGGECNTISNCGDRSAIIGGDCNIIATSSYNASIIGGKNNIITFNSRRASIIGGGGNCIQNSADAAIFSSGNSNIYQSVCSAIIGGNGNNISSSGRSAIIGGQSLSLNNEGDVVYVPNLKIDSPSIENNLTDVLVWDQSNKMVRYRQTTINPFNSGPNGSGGGGGTISSFKIDTNGVPFGATISYVDGYATFTFSAATKLFDGIVTTASQTFSGTKSFVNNVQIGDTSSTSRSGLYLYSSTNNTGNTYSAFFAPMGMTRSFVYQLPNSTPQVGQSLMIQSIVGSTASVATISTTWSFPLVGAGLTQNGGTISLTSLSPNNVVRIFASTTSNFYTASLADNNRLLDVTTGNLLYRVLPPLDFVSKIPGASTSTARIDYSGFEFRVRKLDLSDGVVSIQIGTNSDLYPYVTLTRQNQMAGIKYDSASQSWTGYIIDQGWISPNTVLGNFGNTHSIMDEYQVVDLNDFVQKSPNYTEGQFPNDWLSGVIYQSTAVHRNSGFGGVGTGLFNQINQYIGGLVKQNTIPGNVAISGISIPAFALTKGKQLKVSLAGTFSRPNSGTISFVYGFHSTSGYSTLGNVGYYSPISSTASFLMDMNILVTNGGLSGSVTSFGKVSIEELNNAGAVVKHLHQYNGSQSTLYDFSKPIGLDTSISFSNTGQGSLTILNLTIERLA